MRLHHEKLNYEHPQDNLLLLFTGNAYIKRNGELVMGRGAAKEVRDLYPELALELGKKIRLMLTSRHFYGLAVTKDCQFGVFQVKRHYAEPAEINLINRSVTELNLFARANKSLVIKMNFPGIGFGQLSFDEVYPLVERLPDNVHLYKIESS